MKWAPSSSPSSSLPALQDGHAGKVQFMLPGQGHQAQSALALPSSEPSQKPIAPPARAPSVHVPCTEGQGEAKEAEGTPLQEDEDGDNHGKGHGKTLEDWENETFANLSMKKKAEHKPAAKGKAKAMPKAKAKAKAKTLAMKAHGKPGHEKEASAKTASAKAKAKAKAKAHGKAHGEGQFGYPRCRGNVLGCPTCTSPSYNGIRLPGREAWRAHMAAVGKPIK